MSFGTIPFLFVFFPVSLGLYALLPKKLRPALLLLTGLLFYAWGDLQSLPILLFSILFNYLSGLEISVRRRLTQTGRCRAAMWVAVAVNVLLLCRYKYLSGTFPIGLSFYTFSALSYVLDIYNGRAEAESNPLRAGAYMAFFPKLISGPIVRFSDFQTQLSDSRMTREDIFTGGELLLVGLFKKLLLADNLGRFFTAIHGMSRMAAGTAWLGMILYSLQLYYDFSGYSDMAVGLARMFGFQFEKNFDYPYMSATVSEFWRRWHISLGAWFREYIYIPLGGNRCGAGRQLLNLSLVWILTGIWHGSTLNFLVWGIWHGAFIILERFVIRDRLNAAPRFLRVLTTDFIAFVGWVFFFSPSLSGAISYLGLMFGSAGQGFWDGTTAYYLSSCLLLLLAAVLFSGPVIRNVQENLLARYPGSVIPTMAVIYGILLVFSVAGMVNATYSTFLYFQF